MRVRLAELISSLALATDLATGQPLEHARAAEQVNDAAAQRRHPAKDAAVREQRRRVIVAIEQWQMALPATPKPKRLDCAVMDFEAMGLH